MTEWESLQAEIETDTHNPWEHPRTRTYVLATILSLRKEVAALKEALLLEKKVNTKFAQVLRDVLP